MSSGGKRSMVWQFFNLTQDNKFVVCTFCKKEYKYFKNTTNLKEHLKRLHPSCLLVPPTTEEGDDEDEPSTPSTSKNPQSPQSSKSSVASTSTSTSVKKGHQQ